LGRVPSGVPQIFSHVEIVGGLRARVGPGFASGQIRGLVGEVSSATASVVEDEIKLLVEGGGLVFALPRVGGAGELVGEVALLPHTSFGEGDGSDLDVVDGPFDVVRSPFKLVSVEIVAPWGSGNGVLVEVGLGPAVEDDRHRSEG